MIGQSSQVFRGNFSAAGVYGGAKPFFDECRTEEPRLFIALYTDADVDQALARELRARGFDAVSPRDVANHALSDQAQLDYAIAQSSNCRRHAL